MDSRIRSMMTISMALVLAFGLAANLDAQQHRMAMPDSSQSTLTATSGVAEIPFKLINNHLILPVRVNGSEPLDVALDTGMPAAGLALYDGAQTAALGLDIDPSIQAQIGGAGGSGKRMMAKIAMSESLSLPGLEIDGARVIVMPRDLAQPGPVRADRASRKDSLGHHRAGPVGARAG